MNWKNILKAEKAHCGTEKTENEEKEEFEKKLVGNQNEIDANNDGKITGKDFEILRRKKVKKSIEEEILEEVEDEGGALGMKNLKDIADKKKLKETLSSMEDRGMIFEHEDGDFYTHKPKRDMKKR
jgi:hypothetical protein|tara:strand:+ start:528 stop:905 length:378 start_codon:yes stop_codon:yes gene_type:complete